jgi:hypothetical protein
MIVILQGPSWPKSMFFFRGVRKMKKSSKLFAATIVVLSIVCAGSAILAFAQSPPVEIIAPDYVIGEKTIPLEVFVVGPEADTPLNPKLVKYSSNDDPVSFKVDRNGKWALRTSSVKESTSIVLMATINWGDGEEEQTIEKVITIVPRNSNEAKIAKESSQEAKERIETAYENLAGAIKESIKESSEGFVATEKATATATFVPVRIFVAPYSTLRAYTGTTTNWLYVVAVDASGASKIVSSFTTFTLSKSGVITFPYPLYNANHGNFRAGYTITTVTVTCKYLTLKTSAVVSVIRR